ncbi:TrlF family AAA-like ATPase [Cysteiniphilum litorale]|uniref:TrlF family AAA-like ATPase n=1 Tax=Cysteiniphilum litorale TaxID=2056700 RepID=UPI003F884C8E
MQNNGSVWRKWDLHIHTPVSINQNYGGENRWDSFINSLEGLPQDVKVIGITDYYFIDGYENVMSYKNNGRLANIEKIFPILEFRIDTFGSSNENNLQKINLHILFDLDEKKLSEEIKKVKEEFISRINLSGLDKHKTVCLSKENFIAKGKNNLQNGFASIIPSTKQVLDIVGSDAWKDKVFLFLGYKEWNNLDKNNQIQDTKEDLFNKANAFLSAGEISSFDKKNRNMNIFGNKPLLHSLDIHDFDKLNENYSCNTWIKADPTFEGLKQIVQEPEDRVKIQETKPDGNKTAYSVIKAIHFNSNTADFNKGQISFNPNLNTIIGGRSTGKSTLLQILAYKLGELKNNNDNFERIKKVAEDVSIEWLDGETDHEDRQAEYFPQSYMHNIVKDDNERKKIVENIIGTDQLKSYEKFIADNQLDIKKDISKLLKEDGRFKEITQKIHEIGNEKAIGKEISELNQKIAYLMEENKFTETEKNKFESLKNQLDDANIKKREIESDIECLQNYNKKLISFEYNYDLLELSDKNRELISRACSRYLKVFENRWKKLITRKIAKLDKQRNTHTLTVSNIEENVDYKKGLEFLKQNTTLKELSDKLKQEEEKLEELKKLEKTKKVYSDQIEKLKRGLVEKNCLFESKIEELKNNFSSKGTKNVEIKINSEKLSENNIFTDLSGSINRQAKESKDYVNNFYEKYHGDKQKHIKDFISKVLNDDFKINAHSDKTKLLESILTANPYQYKYDLIYQDDNFESMSEGKRAFVILKLLLEYSDKKCPILIDQPEDSLDNRAIYNELVAYIKNKKKDRQIIIVTHNANLVVNADSEQVIIANQHGVEAENPNGAKFSYKSGSLENTEKNKEGCFLEKKNIKEHICEVLEGGEEAFKKRNDRYLIIRG